MFKVRSLPNNSAKITGGIAELPRSGRVKAIVQVQTAGYVPACTTVRSRIDEKMFTAELDASSLEDLVADPDVVAVSPAERIQPVRRN